MNSVFTESDLWAQAFIRRLNELQPGVDLSTAISICLEVFTEASALDPFEAAETYVAEHEAERGGHDGSG
jgi:hypothetical protein